MSLEKIKNYLHTIRTDTKNEDLQPVYLSVLSDNR